VQRTKFSWVKRDKYEAERPSWEYPLLEMRRGIAFAEPEVRNEIQEWATWLIRSKMHVYYLDVTTAATPHFFAQPEFPLDREDMTENPILESGRFLPVTRLSRQSRPTSEATEFDGFRTPLGMYSIGRINRWSPRVKR